MVIDRYADFERVRSELVSWGAKTDIQVEKFTNGLGAIIIGNAVWSFETPKYFGTEREEDKILQPYNYLKSLPGKNIRTTLIHALNYWFKAPEDKIIIIDDIIDKLYNASLLIDDIEDGSLIRRGAAAAHTVYEIPLTINAAEFTCCATIKKGFKFNHPRAVFIIVHHLVELHNGQGLDIWWRDNHVCPSEDEYCQMIVSKCGGLFRMAIELLRLFSPIQSDMRKNQLIDDLCQALTLLFQIRDDYCNLISKEYTQSKSYCEDLSEGKFSFPIIHALNIRPDDSRLGDILKQRTYNIDLKQEAVQLLHEFGSIEYTRGICVKLANKCYELIDKLEGNLYLKMAVDQLAAIFQVPAETKVE
ncbi:unnamed protein product [Adineta steineri]|uniref:Geranylgeranyl pyrophosphate synthase n=1 Tax=Adineta steineri TaxID=433720 RepID=A0A813S6I9_9BILA|nr:unnamed protein product [Adineta steineri]